MAQHPSDISRASIQSVWVHLVALYLTIEKEIPSKFVSKVMAKITNPNLQFEWLIPPNLNSYNITANDLTNPETSEEYTKLAREWAEDVWNAWSEHQPKIRQLANKTLEEMK